METKLNYTMIGIFVTVLTTVMIIIGIWLSASTNGKVHKHYVTYFKESVSGLNIDAPVKYYGVVVGTVNQIGLNPVNPQEVEVGLEIEEGTPITEATTAIIASQGLTGIAFVDLTPGPSGSPPLRAKNGEPYPVIRSAPSLFARLDYMMNVLATRLSKLSETMQNILSPANQKAFSNTLSNLDIITTQWAKHGNQLLTNTDQMLQQSNKTLRYLSDETLPTGTDTLNRLGTLTIELQGLAQELQQNPSLLIRGREAPPPGPGE